MPGALRVAIWNIQNFGAANQDERRGVNCVELARVIRVFVDDAGVEVLFVMEVMPAAGPSLDQVMFALNRGRAAGENDWVYDWIKGSVDNHSPFPPTKPDELSWKGGSVAPRVEGYAIFWRTNRAAFNLAPAINNMSEGVQVQVGNPHSPTGTNYLELVWQGLPFAYKTQTKWVADGGYNPTTHPLNPFDDQLAAEQWSELDFPWVSKGTDAAPREYKSRRPAFGVLELIGQSAARKPMPFICYHAPSEERRAQIGTYLSALSKQLNVTNRIVAGVQDPANLEHNLRAAIGGDFNYDLFDPAALDKVWGKFINDYDDDIEEGGSDLNLITPNTADQRRTTVQIRDAGTHGFNGPQRAGAAIVNYLSLRIDQLMYRGVVINAAQSRVYPFLDKLMENPSPYRECLRRFKTMFDQLITASGRAPDKDSGPLTALLGLPIYGTSFDNWKLFYKDINRKAARFSTARSAAEFFHVFISDHLPLTLSFQW